MFHLLKKCESCNVRKLKFDKRICKIKFMYASSVRHNSYYDALGLDSTATAKDIKAAYYNLSLQHHPDKNNGSEESVAKFREISEAYEVLSNSEKKRIYDRDLTFRPRYSTNYRQREELYRSKYYGPHTGKTKDFNYDEHFRQHYQKQREMEQEYLRRRWEADFCRRYPTADDYYKKKYTPDENSEHFSNRFERRYYFMYVAFGFWCMFFMSQGIIDLIYDPEIRIKHGPVYYKVKQDDELKNNDKEAPVNQT